MPAGSVQRRPSIHSMTSTRGQHRSRRTHGIFTVGSLLKFCTKSCPPPPPPLSLGHTRRLLAMEATALPTTEQPEHNIREVSGDPVYHLLYNGRSDQTGKLFELHRHNFKVQRHYTPVTIVRR